MAMSNIKAELKSIAQKLPPNASYADAMYELYVRMKIAQGKHVANEGRVISHDDVKRRFAK